MSRILVIGGYGGFGARLSRRLVGAGHEVIVGGRNPERAAAFCADLPGARPVRIDREGDLESVLCDIAPDIVIDAAGPFQDSDYRVPRACVAQGCSYVDLADATEFVTGIRELDEDARAAGVAVISGASSVPALSGAVVRRLTEDLDRVDVVDIALSASTRSTASRSVTGAILSYAGQPIRLWRTGRWTEAFGCSELRRVRFEVAGVKPLTRRWVGLCDVPDLRLLPGIVPGSPSVTFRAGSDRAPQVLGLWVSTWLVRLGLMRSLRPFQAIFLALQKATMWSNSPRSAMQIALLGWRGGSRVERRWTLIAEDGCGPEIPVLAATLLAGRPLLGGARDASRELEMEAFEPLFRTLPLRHTITERRLAPTLYRRALGSSFDDLPSAVREMHNIHGEAGATGEGTVTGGSGLAARLVALVMRFPEPGAYPVHVAFTERRGAEVWVRDFGGHRFKSVLSREGSRLTERFGPLTLVFDVPADRSGLEMRLSGWRLLGIPMPNFLGPKISASETEEDGLFHFKVAASLPLIGKVVGYSGHLRRLNAPDFAYEGGRHG